MCRRLVLEDGSVLRGLLPGRPTADCLFSDVLNDGRSLLKVCLGLCMQACPAPAQSYLASGLQLQGCACKAHVFNFDRVYLV